MTSLFHPFMTKEQTNFFCFHFANHFQVTGDNHITAPTTLQSARVLSVLTTVDTINGKNLSNVATLHEDLYFYGPLSFRSIKARSINTKDTISGIDFDYWYANSLWKAQRDNQIVSGVWTVSEGIFHSTVKGDATLNGMPIENLAGQINAQQSNVQNNLELFYQGYVENCHRMQNVIDKTHTLPYFLESFEESFSIRVQNVLNSVYFFEGNGQNYVVINLGCLTVVYVWNRITESYEKIIETETGNVDSWLDRTDEVNSVHLISNTEVDRSDCPTSGLHIWKFNGGSLIHVSKIAESNKFSLLHSSKLHPQRFLAMTKDDGVIKAFDLQNNLVEQWHLPMNDQQFRFVPESANLGIALSNGKQLSSLSYAKSIASTENRIERSTGPLSDIVELKRYVRCPYLDEKLANATANCKLWHQAKLKALSNIGPFKHLDPITQNRLLKEVNVSSVQIGSSPFKLRIIPSERGPFRSFNLVPPTGGRFSNDTELTTSTAENTIGNANEPMNSTARDAFGDIEKVVTDMADNFVDSLIELETDNQDIDFDDNLVGSSSKDKSKVEPKQNSLNLSATQTNNSQSSTTRDRFGDIEANTIKLTDKVMDAFENFKNTAKESQAKLHNIFKMDSEKNGHYRKMEENSAGEKIENKNLPKIPKVLYTANDTELHATQSPLGTDETDESTTSVEYSSTTTTAEPTTTHFPIEEVGEEEPKISKEISSEGIATAENPHFPSHPAEEIVALIVGENKKHLVAVSSLREHTIQGKHDLIRVSRVTSMTRPRLKPRRISSLHFSDL